MKTILPVVALLLAAGVGRAQLTVDQREFDFRALASHYVKHYAPYEWKRDVFGFDLMDLRP